MGEKGLRRASVHRQQLPSITDARVQQRVKEIEQERGHGDGENHEERYPLNHEEIRPRAGRYRAPSPRRGN